MGKSHRCGSARAYTGTHARTRTRTHAHAHTHTQRERERERERANCASEINIVRGRPRAEPGCYIMLIMLKIATHLNII